MQVNLKSSLDQKDIFRFIDSEGIMSVFESVICPSRKKCRMYPNAKKKRFGILSFWQFGGAEVIGE